MKWWIWTLRIGLAGLFVYAGVIKALDPIGFAANIDAYRLLPHSLVKLTALYLPWLEISVGVGLLLPQMVRGAALVQGLLMLVFTAALTTAWFRGLDITCGCFGSGLGSSNYVWLISRDLALLAAIGCVYFGSQGYSVQAETENKKPGVLADEL